jgi:hypothetical protein
MQSIIDKVGGAKGSKMAAIVIAIIIVILLILITVLFAIGSVLMKANKKAVDTSAEGSFNNNDIPSSNSSSNLNSSTDSSSNSSTDKGTIIDTGSSLTDSKLDQVDNVNEYVFFPSLDSNGDDILNFGTYMPLVRQKCDSLTDCIAYNTDGWTKKKLLTPDKWTIWTDPTRGMYLNSKSVPVYDAGNAYTFYKGREPTTIPYVNLPAGTPLNVIKLECDLRSDCLGYSSTGKLYDKITNMGGLLASKSMINPNVTDGYYQEDP